MTETARFEFSGVTLTVDEWEGSNFKPIVAFEYTEHSPDAWYGDRETTVEVDREEAAEIVRILRTVYPGI